MRFTILRNILLFVIISAVGFGCGDSVTDPDTDPGSDPATIQGRVADENPDDEDSMEGWIVTASEVETDGSLQPLGQVEAETGADGEFTLVIDGEDAANASDNIIIRATKDGNERKAVLTAELESGTTVYAKPLTGESTGEANIYEHLIEIGDADMVTEADIESNFGPAASAELTDEGTVTSMSQALVTMAETEDRSFESQEVEITGDMSTQIEDAQAEAQIQLETDLYNDPDQREQIYDTYHQQLASAYTDAGIGESAYARTRHVSGVMLDKNTEELSEATRAEMRVSNGTAVAIGIDRAVQSRLEAVNADEARIDEAADAGMTLRNEIAADNSATESEVETAFQTYNNAIVTILQEEFPENELAIADANAEINAAAGARAQLDNEVDGVNDAQLVVDAYAAYDDDVESTVNAELMGATTEETDAITDIMVLINLEN